MIRTSSIILSFFLVLTFHNVLAQINLNEWVLENSTGIADADGDHSDWVELYNSSSTAVELNGYGLSDAPAEPYKWVFPSITMQPGEFLLVFCSDKNQFIPELHTNFKLSDEDVLVLTDPLGNTVQSIELEELPYNVSQGGVIDGSTELKQFYVPTPNGSNLDGIPYNQIALSRQPGFHAEAFQLSVSGSEPHEIRYTTDGSEPQATDSLFPAVLSIQDRSSEPLDLSSIPTTAPNAGPLVLWEIPEPNQFKGTVLRLRSFNNGAPSSHIVTASYFIHPSEYGRYSLPVVSIVTDSLNLFDYDTGIYVPGLHHDLDPEGGGVWGTGNFHQSGDEWERVAHVQLFGEDGDIELNQQIGIRIHGTGSRALPQKSLRFYAREIYGEPKMEHEIFKNIGKDEFDVLVLRNMGQDFVTGVAQDVLANRLIDNMYQFKLADRPVISFINGEYWGIQNLRERFDKHYLSAYHELNEDSIDIIDSYYGGVSQGDNVAYFELYNFIADNDLSNESNYEFVEERMHIPDFIDNTLTRIYLGCYDWPGNNIRIWRERSPEGKFRWLLLDNDGCLGNADFNSLEHATDPNSTSWPNPQESTLFLRKLLENEEFKQQFISRMAHLLSTTFDRLRVGVHLTDLFNTYQPEYDEHDSRWKAMPDNTTLHASYDRIMDVVKTRSCHVREHFINYFNLQESEFPYPCDSTDLFLTTNSGVKGGSSLLIYPNPNNGLFQLTIPTDLEGKVYLEIMDVSGSTVYKSSIDKAAGDAIEVNTQQLAAGIYVLQLNDGYVSKRTKMVIQ